jgi:starch synthase
MEYYGNLNLLKTGIAFADRITTVSPRYADEIQTSALGCGLEGLLSHRRDDLSGIINGVDYSIWDPATDPLIAANYDAETVEQGKPICRAALQDLLGLPHQTEAPLIGIISRLADQKGFDLIEQVMLTWAHTSTAQWAILGTGEPRYHDAMRQLADRHPSKIAAKLQFSNALAHQIEAGADIFLMPSQYEPCGLNQLYSLRYGTVPVVRATGGLADTVTNATDETTADGTATGFAFRDYNVQILSSTLWRACDAFRDKRLWSQIVQTGMRQDWSWTRSARQYAEVYELTAQEARAAHVG